MSVYAKSREIFAEQILNDFKSEITGNLINRVVDNNPEEIFFVGKLMSTKSEDSDTSFNSKTFIESISIDFNIKEEEIKTAILKVFPRGDFYYRVYPSLKEQRNALLRVINKRITAPYSNFKDMLKDYTRTPLAFKDFSEKLIPVFKKIQIHATRYSFDIRLSDIISSQTEYGFIDESSSQNKQFNDYLADLQEGINNDDSFYRYVIHEAITVADLIDNDTYASFLARNAKKDVKINQNWSLYIDLSVKKIKSKYFVSTTLVNNSTLASGTQIKKEKNKITLETLFNSGIDVQLIDAAYDSIELDYFLDDYKYNKTQEAVGTNCTVVFDPISNTITTEHLPTYMQKRLLTNDKLAVQFVDLINEPVKVLKTIKNKMLKELGDWKKYRDAKSPELTEKAREKLSSEVREFELEINRYSLGIDVIENYPLIQKSFILMNKTFLNTSKKYSTWRLFQIVFIVSMIPDIASCDENLLPPDEKEKTSLESMALLFFPTGGGKTEAFIGILVFNLFFDRFRGKACGVTSILRYPLRLLSVQQVQRLSNVLAQAELLRRETSEIKSSDFFALGYFVGDRNTPNRLSKDDVQRYKAMPQSQRDESRVIDVCPFCGKQTVHLTVEEESNRLVHYCDNEECLSGGTLPLYIVDTEIYRYLPCAIISTVDKLAILGNNRNFRNILNGAIRRCHKHGYTSTQKCVELTCDVDATSFEEVEMYDPAPTLFIQDELHLIRESLGTYASHYESFLDYYIKHLSKSKRGVKIIGATATISSYALQVHHLYNRDALRFPAASPFQDHNFYAYIDKDDTQRFIMGYAPYGKAIINSVVYSLKYMRQVVNKYLADTSRLLSIPSIGISSDEDAKELLEDYWIFLEYNNVKRDGNNVEGALETPINVELQEEGIKPFITRKMTGDETFQDVREVLALVENSDDVFEGVNLIAATSMISHGVDADRFNVMFFYGIPGNIAEYIQAYSRTGRKHTSVVVDIIRPTRETDQSYLKNFIKFHEYKDILVEAVPINRWATKAIDNTLPGILSGLLLNYYDLELQYTTGTLFMMKNIKKAIDACMLNKDIIKNQLAISYGCTDGCIDIELGNQYKSKIDAFVDDIFEKIQDRAWLDENIFAGFTLVGYRIMNSLRDTDAQLIIELD